MKRSKTEYRGSEAIVLSTSAFELVVTTTHGPRIVSFKSFAGTAGNLFFQLPENEDRLNGMYLRGGHRLWHSPEDAVRTYQPDDDPLDVKLVTTGVALTQPIETKTGIEKAMKIEVRGERTIKITHTLTNQGLWAMECAAWAITMLRGGGYGVLPFLPRGDHTSGDLLPNTALVPWTYTDLSLPVWKLRRDYVGIDVAKAKIPQKLGLTNYPGWIAYSLKDTTFVKYAPLVASAVYPDLGCAVEAFTNGAMIELETLGPLTKLSPRQSVNHVEYWTLLDHQPKVGSDRSFAESLLPAVNRWLKSLDKRG